METKEIREILVSASVLAIAFGIVFSRGGTIPIQDALIVSFATVSTGFILHELGHRFVARKYGAHAEYRMWNMGLLLALVSSAFGFIIASPGAVYIYPKSDLWGRRANISKKVSGLTSITGPLINVALALGFFLADLLYPLGIVAGIGIFINIWLALFNMLPFPPLDGSKVLAWDKKMWAASFVIIVLMFFVYTRL